jgi:D-alanine-D-alanine ligase
MMKRRSIACVIDRDIIEAVRRGRKSSKRAAYDLSLVRALRPLFASVHLVSATERSSGAIEEIVRLKPSVVFNLAFSAAPTEASFAGALEVLGIPYTGSGPMGIALANDKIRSRRLLAASGIRVPRFVALPSTGRPPKIDFPPPFIVKPVSLANSFGINADSIVDSYAQAIKRAERVWTALDAPSVCDEFIIGREFHVALLEGARGRFRIAAIVELAFGKAKPGRGFKSEEVRVEGKPRRVHRVTFRAPKLPPKQMAELARIACAAAEVLGIRGYAKVDLRMDDQQRIAVIEVNANPGLLSTSVLWHAPTFQDSLKQIIAAAFRRARELA